MLKIKHIEFLALFVYILAVLTGVKEFNVWPQVTEWLTPNDAESNLQAIKQLIEVEHPHFFRILLIVPIYILSEYLSIEVNLFFSFITVFFLFGTYWLNVAILRDFYSRSKLLIILFFLIVLSLQMHGRIVYAVFGNTLLLYVLYRNYCSTSKLNVFYFLVLLTIGFWFVNVSSGTLFVFILGIAIFGMLHLFSRLPLVNKKTLLSVGMFVVLLITVYPLILIYTEKNLLFYNGNVVDMLSHGMGGKLIKYFFIAIPMLTLLILFLPVFVLYLKKFKVLTLPISMIGASFVIGLFGFSSLVSGVSGYIIFIYLFFHISKYRGLQYV